MHYKAIPNSEPRKADVNFLVIHATATKTFTETIDCFLKNNTSAHYLISRKGNVYQCVAPSERAYHAGLGGFSYVKSDMNSHSIGIEFVAPPFKGEYASITKAQRKAGIKLCQLLIQKYNIPPCNVIAHSDLAPHRKHDPGLYFPWADFAKAGIGLYPIQIDSAPVKINTVATLKKIGYQPNLWGLDNCIIAFKRHFMGKEKDTTAEQTEIFKKTLNAVLKLVRNSR